MTVFVKSLLKMFGESLEMFFQCIRFIWKLCEVEVEVVLNPVKLFVNVVKFVLEVAIAKILSV